MRTGIVYQTSLAHPAAMIDDRDQTILSLLQENSDMPLAEIAARVSLSASACSRRIQRLETDGHIAGRVALLDRGAMNLPTTIFVLVKTSQHALGWLEEFRAAVTAIPEIVEVHRLTGNVDYIMKIVLPNVEHYDVIYKRLVSRIELFEMSAYISMETLKFGTAVPTRYA
jgi:Lrp/AsnC family transcriptional regulator